MVRVILVLVGLLIVGCTDPGPKVGDIVEVRRAAAVYFDEGLFKTASQLERAKSDRRPEKPEDTLENKWDDLRAGDELRILERTPDGLKVLIEKIAEASGRADRLNGKIGWVLKSDVGPD